MSLIIGMVIGDMGMVDINICLEGGNQSEILIKNYNLNNDSGILDVGCGKGFYYEIKLLLPGIKIKGLIFQNMELMKQKKKLRIIFLLQGSG